MAVPAIITDGTFEAEVLKAEGPVLVCFRTEWSQPCRQLVGTLSDLPTNLPGKVRITLLDIERNPIFSEAFDVRRATPTLVLFRDGKPIAWRHGSWPRSAIVEWLEEKLA